MDFYEIQIYLIDQLAVSNDSPHILRNFLSKIRTAENSSIIDNLSKLDFEGDSKAIEKSITHILFTNPPNIKIKGFWFGIFDAIENETPICQAYLCGSNKAALKDETAEWATAPGYFPENRYFSSTVLSKLPKLIDDGLEEYELNYFALWYLSVVIANYCKSNAELLLNTTKCLISVGFDSGDFVNIGQITTKGFELLKFKIQKPQPLKKTKTNFDYYGLQHTMNNAWFLSVLDDDDLAPGFAASGKPMNLERKYTASAITGLNQYPIDFNEAAFGVPIVSQKHIEILLDLCNKDDFEYTPIKIENVNDPQYYILNVLKTNKCLNSKETVWYTNNYAKDMAFSRSQIKVNTIFRLKSKDIHHYIYVNSKIKEMLELKGITGIKLVPIRMV